MLYIDPVRSNITVHVDSEEYHVETLSTLTEMSLKCVNWKIWSKRIIGNQSVYSRHGCLCYVIAYSVQPADLVEHKAYM